MPAKIDARGLACPQPVILAKKAIEENEDVIVLVDNAFAVENIRRMAARAAFRVSVADKGNDIREITLTRTGNAGLAPGDDMTPADELSCGASPGKERGPFVVILSDNRMGRGDDSLGDILIRGFLHALLQLTPPPDAIICYNAGVRLAVKDSAVLDDLQQLAQAGVDILVCGTCLNYFGLTETLAAGRVSNMYDIVETMAGAGRLLRP